LATEPLSGFHNLSTTILPIPSCHFQAGNTPGVLPFRGFRPSRSSNDSSPLDCLLDVSSCRMRSLPPRWETPTGARFDFLGVLEPSLFVFKAFFLVRITGLRSTFSDVRSQDSPLGPSPPHGSTCAKRRRPPSSREKGHPSQGLTPPTTSPTSPPARRGIMGSPRRTGIPCGTVCTSVRRRRLRLPRLAKQ